MIYSQMTKEDNYYLLEEGQNKLYIPFSKAIVIDDSSDLISFRAVGSRKNLAQVRK